MILYVDDVDALYQRLVQSGLTPSTTPQDAPWDERYFHINDPDSHELSFAKRLDTVASAGLYVDQEVYDVSVFDPVGLPF